MAKILLPLFFSLLISLPFIVISQSTNSDRSILLDLKQQWGNPPSIQSWNSSSSPCDWPEITCAAGSGEVTGIFLSDKRITEKIPATICDLPNLTAINLAWNYIPGEFPVALYSCFKLQYLNLSQNLLVGELPGDIYRLTSLQHLDVAGNNFSGDIPPAIGNLTELKVLNLNSNLFNGSVPGEIGNLSNLETLDLSFNGEMKNLVIPEELGKLAKLKELRARLSNLIGQIPETFSSLTSLTEIDLAMNNLTGKIPDGMFSLLNLRNVFLFHNHLTGEIPVNVLSTSLEQVDLAMNNLTGSIPPDFGKLSNLTVLNLYMNKLTGGIPASLALITTLKGFRVFKNQLNGTIPPEMGLHSALEGFEVSENQLSGALPENLCSKGMLQGAIAFSNKLTGELPKDLGSCPSLRAVQVYDNNFSGELPAGLWTSMNLTALMISNNSFTGQLPKTRLASNLSRLEISNNNFVGEIPIQVSSWESLVVFKASGNMFTGKIPVEITSLSQLNTLLLDGNRFSGELPTKIIAWGPLTTLDLSRNELTGLIPSALGSLPDLLYLDLSANKFSGQIPTELGQLRLNTLNLSSNELSGRIPDVFDSIVYENSFLNNTNLCAKSSILNLPSCSTKIRSSHKLSSRVLAMILVLSIVVFVVTVLLTFFVVRDYCRKKRGQDLATWKLTSFQRLDFTEFNVLQNLTDANLIGSGGSGKVYRVSTNCPHEYVAVKRIWNSKGLDRRLEKEFNAEVEVLGSIRHSNIVKLLCCISSENSKLLVYEYMENRSLDKWLHGKKTKQMAGMNLAHHVVLDWPKRLEIAIGAAQGLYYMHHECSPPVIHRDVKSSNILLDTKFKARIADFGLAKILAKHGEGDPHTMSVIAGSFGYIAPEYAYTTKINEKIDVYSFGVVLLELTTGRQPNSGGEYTNLAEWAWQQHGDAKNIDEALDADIKKTCYLEEMATVFKLGLICTSTMPANRPSMKEVLHILRGYGSSDGYDIKKVGSEFDILPLLNTATYLSSYKRSKKKDDSIVFSV